MTGWLVFVSESIQLLEEDLGSNEKLLLHMKFQRLFHQNKWESEAESCIFNSLVFRVDKMFACLQWAENKQTNTQTKPQKNKPPKKQKPNQNKPDILKVQEFPVDENRISAFVTSVI